MSGAPPAPAPAAAAATPRRGWRRLAWTLAAVLLVGAAAGGTLGWLWHTTAGLQAIVHTVDRLLPAHLQASGLRGSLAAGFGADRLVYRHAGVEVEIEQLDARLADVDLGLALGALRIAFAELAAARLAVRLTPSGAPSTGPPASIASPVAISAQRLALGRFELVTDAAAGSSPLTARQIEAAVAIGPAGYEIRGGRITVGPEDSPLQAQLEATLAGARPFALAGRGTLATQWREHPLQASVEAGGDLLALQLDAGIDSGAARGRVRATLDAFEPPTLRALAIDLANLDPSQWLRGAPQAQLTVRAELAPQPVPAGEPFTVRGPVSVDNAAPGTIDAGRLPLRSLRAQLQLNARGLQARELAATLLRGELGGSVGASFGPPPAFEGSLRLSGVDPSTLHSRLQPLLIDGSAEVRNDGSRTALQADLRNRRGLPVQLQVDLVADDRRAVLNTARLTLGPGVAMARGELEFQGSRALKLAGTVAEFDPSLLVAGIDARLNGSFLLDGTLAPQPAGVASFALAESRAFGHPLLGRGVLTLAADQSLVVDGELSARSATLTARGGLGAPGRRLALTLDVPKLSELGLPLGGQAALQAQLSGAWQAPAVEAQLQAGRLVFGEHRIETLQATARYAGGSDGALALQASAGGHQFRANPVLSLSTLKLDAEGRVSDHRLTLAGSNQESQPVALALAGGWSAALREWRGTLRSARAGRPFDLELLAPAALATDLRRTTLGPAALQLAGARFDDVTAESAPGLIATRGRFAGFKPGELRGAADTLLAPSGGRRPLALDGHWNLRLGTQADGQVRIERSDGDIYAGRLAMGIDTAWLQLDLKANRLAASGALHGERAGSVQLQAQLELERADGIWRIAQQRPLAVQASADLPSIGWINTLLGDSMRANLRLGGRLAGNLRVAGTPAAPDAAGQVRGEDLRVTWLDQGLRLEGGTLAARVDGSQIVLEQLRFAGATRNEAGDRRVREAAARAQQAPGAAGHLTINGQLQLRDLSGVLQMQAERMPFLQRTDRWVIATGGANMVFNQRLVQLNGALAVDAGFVDFTRADLPSLSGDVQVVRRSAPPASREPPIGFALDVGIDLGGAFYLRGAGLDTRVDGALRLRSDARGGLRATGALEAHDGTYEGFGQKLAIARGRVNFQGPIENPGLDILALRTGLPVEVGVSITRTAANPLIRLHSEEGLPDHQILSWLVLGRAGDEAGADRLALAQAAAGLLSGGGEGIPTQLARRLGIDQFGLRSGEVGAVGSLLPRQSVAGNVRAGNGSSVAGDIVTIGKRINDAISVSYEQAIGGAASVVQVSYQLSKRVSVIARAGTENALDLVYTFAFD